MNKFILFGHQGRKFCHLQIEAWVFPHQEFSFVGYFYSVIPFGTNFLHESKTNMETAGHLVSYLFSYQTTVNIDRSSPYIHWQILVQHHTLSFGELVDSLFLVLYFPDRTFAMVCSQVYRSTFWTDCREFRMLLLDSQLKIQNHLTPILHLLYWLPVAARI